VAKRLKTKREYQCAHCDKIFTKKWNWESHLRTHGDNQRLQCPNCDQTCARQGDLARHMRLHDPDSAVKCGGVLPNGRRWGCGTNFARLDVLRTHHKSKKGRRCIAGRDSEEQSTASTA
jgi:DNA-directed RNA polymerase subunit RPC12/RpoP